MAKRWPVPARCPVCGGTYVVTQLQCEGCGSRLRGSSAPAGSACSTASRRRSRKCSSPAGATSRKWRRRWVFPTPLCVARLDDVLETMGYPVKRKDDKSDVLEALSRGEISVEDAASAIGKWQKTEKKEEEKQDG